MKSRSPDYSAGFTLIEMAVVLIAVGLLIGGVMVGRDLIHAAEIRKTINQLDSYNAAVTAFQTKYHCLPGDCRNASAFGFDPISNGNGDGVIGLCSNVPGCLWNATIADSLAKETVNVWYHLYAAGLIKDSIAPSAVAGIPGVNTPKTDFDPGFAQYGWTIQADVPFYYDEGAALLGSPPYGAFRAHSFVLSRGTSSQSSVGSLGAYRVDDIAIIDAKLDDGFPTSGNARAFTEAITHFTSGPYYFSFGSNGIGPGGPNTTACVRNDVTPYTYNLTDGAHCGLVIKAGF